MVHQAGPAEWPDGGAGDAAAASQGAPRPPTWLSGYRVAAGQATGDRESHRPVHARCGHIAPHTHASHTRQQHMKIKTRSRFSQPTGRELTAEEIVQKAGSLKIFHKLSLGHRTDTLLSRAYRVCGGERVGYAKRAFCGAVERGVSTACDGVTAHTDAHARARTSSGGRRNPRPSAHLTRQRSVGGWLRPVARRAENTALLNNFLFIP
ncbi:hypothetical protein K1T71_006631 [Dendrolimus kikuchii]|uniref:Uncharacterized protein n=1 Tax=Dendrolimus kikuchii TaxID=765133 RepID=A0ACC1D1E7_9NEOP|nr:hypothetical protein K1T71_006631 [Dendrolimus kikuchii]